VVVGRVVGTLLLCSVLAAPTVADEEESNHRSQRGFTVAGVALGMEFGSVVALYPAAKIDDEAANCYSYGRRINIPALTRHVLRHHDDIGDLTLRFAPPSDGGRLSGIHYDRPVDRSTLSIRELVDDLSARYGPYDRILHRRKMEPAGRIVGFEWLRSDGATLRAVLRQDFGNGSDEIRMTLLARSTAAASRPARRTVSTSCPYS